jgi:hypothetical protein
MMVTQKTIHTFAEYSEHTTLRKDVPSPHGYRPTPKPLLQSSFNPFTHNPALVHAMAAYRIRDQQVEEP